MVRVSVLTREVQVLDGQILLGKRNGAVKGALESLKGK